MLIGRRFRITPLFEGCVPPVLLSKTWWHRAKCTANFSSSREHTARRRVAPVETHIMRLDFYRPHPLTVLLHKDNIISECYTWKHNQYLQFFLMFDSRIPFTDMQGFNSGSLSICGTFENRNHISLETQLPELSRLVLWGAGFIHASKSYVAVP